MWSASGRNSREPNYDPAECPAAARITMPEYLMNIHARDMYDTAHTKSEHHGLASIIITANAQRGQEAYASIEA